MKKKRNFLLPLLMAVVMSVSAQVTNRALTFEQKGRVSVGTLSDLNNAGAWTVQMWINPTKWTTGAVFMQRGSQFAIKMGSSNSLDVTVGNETLNFANTGIYSNTWNHITLIGNGQTLKLYVNNDGEQTKQMQAGQMPETEDPVLLGGGFTGRMDEVRIWKCELPSDPEDPLDNKRDYLNTVDSNHEEWNNLVAYYRFDQENLEGNVYDYSGHSHNGTFSATGVRRTVVEDNTNFIGSNQDNAQQVTMAADQPEEFNEELPNDEIEPATPVYKEDGTTIDHYNIGNVGQLLWFSNFVNTKEGSSYPNCKANAVLTADIVVNDGEFTSDGTFTPLGETEGATPISVTPMGTTVQNAYKGTFDGDGHTISGLYFAGGESDEYVGLFGYIYDDAVVKRLGVTNVYYSGIADDCDLGAIAGFNKGTIENCYSTGVLKNTGTGDTGGICGDNSGTIKNCYTTIKTSFVFGNDNSRGGVTNCYALGNGYYAADFASGKICYRLNGSVSIGEDAEGCPIEIWTAGTGTPVWYQRLGDGGDDYPVLKKASDGSNTVYYGYDGCTLSYANAALSQTQGAHNYTDKTLAATADEGTGLYSYLCDKCGADSKDVVKVIKDYAPNATGAAKNLELTVTTDGETTTYSTSEAIALTDANQFKNVNVSFSTTQAPTYTREMKSEWGTIVLPFEVSTQTDDYDLYKCETLLDGRLVMRILPANEAVPAGYPAFVYKKTYAESVTFTATGNAEGTSYAVNTALSTPSIGTAMALCGTYAALPKTNSNTGTYFIYNDKFWNVSELSDGQTVTILPFHAYIQEAISEEGPGNMNAKLVIVVAGDATSINNEQLTINNVAGAVYNLNGQRLAAPQKGLNIINGKKVMVK